MKWVDLYKLARREGASIELAIDIADHFIH